jgi:hypothetical protein
MSNLKGVVSAVGQLKKEKANLRRQLDRVESALAVLGKLNGTGGPRRILSASARRRIAAAQRARWAKVRAAKKAS